MCTPPRSSGQLVLHDAEVHGDVEPFLRLVAQVVREDGEGKADTLGDLPPDLPGLDAEAGGQDDLSAVGHGRPVAVGPEELEVRALREQGVDLAVDHEVPWLVLALPDDDVPAKHSGLLDGVCPLDGGDLGDALDTRELSHGGLSGWGGSPLGKAHPCRFNLRRVE
jgi:hypothetical protein